MARRTEVETNGLADLSRADLHRLLYQMQLIRRFEERAAEMYTRQKIAGFLHLYIGEEAVGVGAISVLRPEDYVVSHYREHGHALARGMDPKVVMAELFGRASGCSRGKGGSMHLFDADLNFMGGYAIVGGHLPIACGLALAAKYQRRDSLVLTFFGDGAVNQGEFHESLNLAAVWKLPVLFFCENNQYAMGTRIDRVSAVIDVYKRTCGYAIPSEAVDGMDVLAVRQATARAAAYIRAGNGPYLIEARTYRFRAHSMADAERYREKGEVERWRRRDPIARFHDQLAERGLISEEEWQRIRDEVEAVCEEAIRFADASPEPPLEALYEDVYAPSSDVAVLGRG